MIPERLYNAPPATFGRPYRAAMAAFAEDYWPEEWEDAGSPDEERYYGTVTEASATRNREEEGDG